VTGDPTPADAILASVSETSEPVPEVVYYPSGLVKERGFRLDGELHGAWEWFRRDGTIMRSGSFDRGRQVGVWRTFERSGRLVKETTFKAP
jgi:antitoxin component YwqK of YwqJK toxin-antitoxin module